MADREPSSPPDFGVDFNPYAPPKADLSPRAARTEGRKGAERLEPFSIDAVMRRAWRVYCERFGLCVAVVAAPNLLPVGFLLIGDVFIERLEAHRAPAAQVSAVVVAVVVATAFLQLWLGIGQMLVLLRLARGETTRFEDVYRGGKYVFRFLAGSVALVALSGGLVLFSLFAAGAVLMILSPLLGENALLWRLVLLWGVLLTMLFAVPFLLARILQFPFVLIDRDCGSLQAIQASLRMTRGHVWELGGLMILSSAIGAIGLLACFVGSVFTIPFGFMIYACGYVLLAGSRSPVDTPQPAEITFFDE
jgi:hypothetical protein